MGKSKKKIGEAARKKAESADQRDIRALQMIFDCKPELYVSIVGKPTITLPLIGEPQSRRPYYLWHDRVRAEVCAFIQKSAGFLPFEREIKRIFWCLAGHAWKDVRTNTDYLAAVNQHPIIEAVHILTFSLGAGSTHESTASELWAALNEIGLAQGLGIERPNWPKAANALSEELWELRPTLNSGGLEFDRGRRNGARWVTLRRIRPRDDDGDLSSLDRPERKTSQSNDFAAGDDSDGPISPVFLKVQAPS